MLHYARHPARAVRRTRASGTLILGRDDWREQFAESVPRSLLAFQFVGDDNARHNLPFAPLLTFVPALLAPLGLVVCLCRWRRPAYALVPLWFAVALVPGLITLEAPHASRLLDTIVPVALMIGIAVDVIAGAPLRHFRWRRRVPYWQSGSARSRRWPHGRSIARTSSRGRACPSSIDAFFPYESAPARYLAAHIVRRRPSFSIRPRYWNPTTRLRRAPPPRRCPPTSACCVWRTTFRRAGRCRAMRCSCLPRPYASLADGLRALSPAATCEK